MLILVFTANNPRPSEVLLIANFLYIEKAIVLTSKLLREENISYLAGELSNGAMY